MSIVRFPDGTHVRGSSISDRRVDDPERTFGLYLDAQWQPTWPATVVAWVRAAYRREAVETADQEAWVRWFAEWADTHAYLMPSQAAGP